MRLCRFVPTLATGAAFALTAANALAQPAPPLPPAATAPIAAETLVAPGQDLHLRTDWIEQCRQRISTRGGRRAFEADQIRCAGYYDDYYAYYARYASGYGQAGNGAAMMTVPVTFSGRTRANCRETIEYEDVPVVARRVIHRPPPRRDKRIRIAPDKRLRSD